MSRLRTIAGGRLAAALPLLAATTLACSGSPAATPRTTAGGSGAQVAVDASGRLRAPTPDEALALSLAMQAEASVADQARPLTTLRLANGARVVVLDERFESTVLASTSAAGAHTTCVGSAAEAGGTPTAVASGAEDR